MDWGTIASILSSVMVVATVIGMLRASGKTRAEEIQSIRDECRDRMDAHAKDDRDKRKAIYEEIDKKVTAIYDEMGRRFKDVESDFVRRQMCDILHGALKEGIDGVRCDIRRLNEMDGG